MQDYCIIDQDAAWQLFGSNNVAGMTVKIGGIPHIIAGVVERPADNVDLSLDRVTCPSALYASAHSLALGFSDSWITEASVRAPSTECSKSMIRSSVIPADTQSAISGALNGYEYVITTANKPVEAGKLVRMPE